MMDPEDVKSLDSAEGMALSEEQSENNSSNSDIVHVEREDAELLEEGGETVEEVELQSSVLSVLGSEGELAAVREEVPSAPVVSVEEPTVVTENPPEVSDAPPPALYSAAVTSLPEPELQSQLVLPELLPAPAELQSSSPIIDPLSVLAPAPDLETEPVQATLEKRDLPGLEQKATCPAQDLPVSEPPVQTQSSDLPVLLYGGAALVAIAAVLLCGALAYRRK